MNTFMLPTNEQFVETIAKTLCRERLYRDAVIVAETILNRPLGNLPDIDTKFDKEFEFLWNSKDEESQWNRESYRADALVAINKINLLLLTMT